MYRYIVSGNILLTPSVRLLTLVNKNPKKKPLLFQPGQYASISLRDKLRPTVARCFSIASSPTQGGVLQFGIRVKGKYTSALERLKEGDTVAVRGPFGSFVFNEQMYQSVTMFAGGIGIAPFMSMIRYATDTKAKTPIHLVYSSNSEGDTPFLSELIALEETNPNFQVTYILSDGQIHDLVGKKVIGGTLNEVTIDQLNLLSQEEMYLICGPPLYMEAVQGLLKSKGVSRKRMLSEAFTQGGGNQDETLTRWPFNAYALSGLLLAVTTGYIVADDLNKTLPKVENDHSISFPEVDSLVLAGGGDLNTKINSIPPQVDTNITQEPIITYIPNPENTKTVSPSETPTSAPTPKPAPQPKPIPTPTPKPTPTVVPKTPPKSTVS